MRGNRIIEDSLRRPFSKRGISVKLNLAKLIIIFKIAVYYTQNKSRGKKEQ